MKKFSFLSLPVALACFLGTCAIGVLSFAIIVAESLIPGLALPFSYYEALNVPVLIVLLPVVGIVVLTPVVVAMALAYKPNAASEPREATETETETEIPTTLLPGAIQKDLAHAA